MLLRAEPGSLEGPPREAGDELAVGEREVGRRRHGPQVRFPFGTLYGRGGELPVFEVYAVFAGRLHATLDIVLAYLMPQAPRAGVEEDRDPPRREPVGARRLHAG